MQEEGTPKFLKYHQGSVRGVAFSPRVSLFPPPFHLYRLLLRKCSLRIDICSVPVAMTAK